MQARTSLCAVSVRLWEYVWLCGFVWMCVCVAVSLCVSVCPYLCIVCHGDALVGCSIVANLSLSVSVTGKRGAGIPIVLLHDAAGSIVSIELKNGCVYKGLLDDVQDNMNCLLKVRQQDFCNFIDLIYISLSLSVSLTYICLCAYTS